MSLSSITEHARGAGPSTAKWIGSTVAALIVWGAVYSQLVPFADWVVASLPVDPKSQSRRGDPLLRLRHAEGVDAAHAGRLRHGRRAQLLLAREDPGAACREARRRRQRAGRGSRHRHSLLLLFRRAAVHRLRQRGRAARRDLFVPDLGADGERGGARASVRTGRLEGGAHLSRLRPCRRHRLRLGHRPAASRTLAAAVGAQHSLGRGRSPAGRTFGRRPHQGRYRRRARRSSARSGPGSSPASPSAHSSTAMCLRTCWPRSWDGTPGGRCRQRC